MQIPAGTRIGPYEVMEEIGAGGMGRVYRAHDARLGRDVAIKTLPEHLGQDQHALARFEREARFVASLNHPNIAAIYGVEEHSGERVLVLEMVRGETLDQLMAGGRLPLDRALHIAAEIASALEAAHGAGIIHRDLKPSNVKIGPDGHVKLLDFGVAKHREGQGEEGGAATELTRAGAVVGTPRYMSPEQISGEPVDRRADIWSFGCVLYEMLAGRPAFEGSSYASLASAILNEEPDWDALPSGTPATVRQVAARCLRKKVDDRLHDIADARVELHDALAARSTPPRRRLRPMLVAAAVAVVAAIVGMSWRAGRAADDAMPLAPKLTQLTSGEGTEEFPAWAPDGDSVVYAGSVGGVRKLFVRSASSGVERQLTHGGFDDIHPAFTPDGKRVLFVRGREPGQRVQAGEMFSVYERSAGDIWVVDVQSGRESRLIENAFYPAVSPDGRRIAFDASWAGPRRIWITDERGFNPQQLTAEASEAVDHIHPRWSPDGRRVVYQRIERTKFDLAMVDVATRATTALTNDNYRDINPTWGAGGRSIYFSSDRGGGINVWRLAVDRDGTPEGAPRQLTNGAGQDVQITVSPDGARLAYATLHQNADLWRLPISGGRSAGAAVPVVGSSREDSRGSWSPDGRSVAFNSDRGGDMNVWVHDLQGGGTRQVTRGAGGDFQPQWSPDGAELVFFSSRSGTADIWKVSVASGELTQLTSGGSLDINPFFSPDGRHVVYQSDSSGRMELWIVRADGSDRRQLTDIGSSGHFQRWLNDGWIYFRSPTTSALMRVRPEGGEPQLLHPIGGAHISFTPDVSRLVDVSGHKTLRVWTLRDGALATLFEFPDANVRIDYPSVSPDGRWLLFDRFRPEGGDIWLAEGPGPRRR